MMKRLFLSAALAVVAVLGVTLESQANGGLFRRQSGCNSGSSTGCNSGCDSTPACASTVTAAPAPVQYEERKVTAYKYITVEKEIDTVISKRVTRDEKYTYTVAVPVTKQETRKETIYVRQDKQVEYKYTVMVPKTVTRVVKQTSYDCVRENIIENVPVCRIVCVTYTDECGRCCTKREQVTTMEQRTRCVVKRIPIIRDVTVNEVICEQHVKVGTRTVCEMIPQVRDVVVNVCTIEHQKREGVRQVSEYVNEKVKQKVQVSERQAYETTVRVAIGGTGCEAPCATSYNDCNSGSTGHGHRKGGLFRRN